VKRRGMVAFFWRGGLAATRDDQPVDRVPMKRFRESACRDRDLRRTPELFTMVRRPIWPLDPIPDPRALPR
jgi:hypothetical protein